MKKYMIADLLKDSRKKLEYSDLADFAKEINKPVDQIIALWKKGFKYQDEINQVYDYSEDGAVNPEEFDPEDLENLEEMGWDGFIGSSMGDIEFEYDITLKQYNVTITFNDGSVHDYSLDPDDVISLDGNAGNYYNENIRIFDRNYYPFRNRVPDGPHKL